MKKMSMIIPGALLVMGMGYGMYALMNKKTRKKAEKVIDHAFDSLDNVVKEMEK